MSIPQLLDAAPVKHSCDSFLIEQYKDPQLADMAHYLQMKTLPADRERSQRVVSQSPLFMMVEGVLCFIRKSCTPCPVVPQHLRNQLMEEHHRRPCGSHFAGKKLFQTMVRHWWWQGMHSDIMQFTQNCPECTIVSGGGKTVHPPLHPIEVQRPFQVVGVQKAHRIARILCDELIPMFGVPEALLSDRGTNLLSHLMRDVCRILGIKKLNTTAYHPQCNGMVERLYRTLKAMLRKHAGRFGLQWDQFLPGALWAYRNTPHESTKEKPSFLLFGMDLRSPSQAALFPPSSLTPTTVEDYREELITSLSVARELAAASIKESQYQSKQRYDRKATVRQFRQGDWVLVRFLSDETGRTRKLSQPWHGPYRVLDHTDTTIKLEKVYRAEHAPLHVHKSRVKFCPLDLPPGYYWYGRRHCCPGKVPEWVQHLTEAQDSLEHVDPCYTQQTALPEFALDDAGDKQDYELPDVQEHAKGTTGQDDPCHTPHVKTHNDTGEPASPLNKCPEDAQGSLSDTITNQGMSEIHPHSQTLTCLPPDTL